MRRGKILSVLVPLGVFVFTWNFNLGTIRGCGTGANGTDGTPGTSQVSSSDITDFELENATFTGSDGGNGDSNDTGNGGNGGNGGDGILLSAGHDITDVELDGTFSGGNGGDGGASVSGNGGMGGDGGAGIALVAGNNIGDVEIRGTITGGNGGNGGNSFDGNGGDGGIGGDGVFLGTTLGDISNVEIDPTLRGGNGGNGGSALSDGGTGGNGGEGGNGIALLAGNDISNVEIQGSTITGGNGGNGGASTIGGNGGTGGDGGDGVSFDAGHNVNGVELENSGTIAGGKGGNGGSGFVDGGGGGGGGAGVSLDAAHDINNTDFSNSGTVAGGNGGDGGAGVIVTGGDGHDGGEGFSLAAGHDINGVKQVNSGAITGGAGGAGGSGGSAGGHGGDGGEGISLTADNNISNVELENSGKVTGGAGGNGGAALIGFLSGGGDGGRAFDAFFIGAGHDINHVEVENSGAISGGNGGAGGSGGDIGEAGDGGDGSAGIFLSAGNNITDVELSNSSAISGGNGGDGNDGGSAGAGVLLHATGNISGVEVESSGSITGGNGGNASSGTFDDGPIGGTGGAGVELTSDAGSISNVELENSGTIKGGNGGNATITEGVLMGPIRNLPVNGPSFSFDVIGGDAGSGVFIGASGNITNIEIENSGTISGGNGGDATRVLIGPTGATGQTTAPQVSDSFSFLLIGGQGEHGIFLLSDTGNISDIKIDNSGTVTGGNGGNVSGGSTGPTGPTGNIAIGPLQPSPFAQGPFGGEGGEGILIEAINGGITGVEIENSKTITGGNGGSNTSGIFTEGGGGGSGVSLQAGTDITNIMLENEGTITGGNGGNNNDTSDDSIGGNGGHGVSLIAERNINNVAMENSGTVTGGNGGDITTISIDIETQDPKAGDGGHGIFFSAGSETDTDVFIIGSITNVTLINRAGGTITGGDGGSASSGTSSTDDPHGGRGGDGISFSAGVNITDDEDDFPPTDAKNNINHVTLINRGTITGGGGGDGENGAATDSPLDLGDGGPEEGPDAGSVGGNGGHGVSFVSYTGDITDIFLRNFGTITGGDGGGAVGDIINTGGNGGNGINFQTGLSVSDVEELGYSDDIRRITIINDGTVTGGDGGTANNSDSETSLGGNDGGNGGHGIAFTSTTGDISDITIFNCRSGTITGGNGGAAGDGNTETDFPNHGGEGGAGIYFHPGASGFDPADLSNITINNFGSVAGGEGADPGGTDSGGPFGNGGDGIFFDGGNGSNIVVNNFGSLTGGDAGDIGEAGAGIHSTVDNVTVNNWGNISGGLDGSAPVPNAILIDQDASNNRVNLRGFSVIHGLIEGEGGANNSNTLNFAFSGVNKAAAAALQTTLAPFLTGFDSSGSITFRGETYQWDDIIVEVNTTSYQQQGITKNQKAIGRNLDGFTSTPSDDMRLLLAAVDISGDVPDALNQLSPQRYQLYGDIALANANFNTFGVDARLNNLREGSESIDTSCLRIASSQIESRLGFSKDDGKNVIPVDRSKDGKNVELPAPEKEKRFGAFVSGDIIQGNVDGRNADLEEDANFTTAGLMAGVDARLCKSLVAGLLFSYGHTNSDLDTQGSNVKVNTYSGGVYAGFQHGPWYANGLALYSANDYDSRRVTLPFLDCPPMHDRIARADTFGNQFSGNLDGGYDFHVSQSLTVAPTAGLQYVRLDVNRFDEIGAGAADLAVRDQTVDSLRSRLGGRLTFRKPVNRCVAVALETRAAWQHEFLDDSRAITAEFIDSGLGTFTVHTTDPQRDAALVGAGLNTTFYGWLTVFLDYDAQVGQASYLEQGGRGGLKVRF